MNHEEWENLISRPTCGTEYNRNQQITTDAPFKTFLNKYFKTKVVSQ